MTRHTVSSSTSGSWSIHDTWTQAFVGTRHLVYELLPAPGARLQIEMHALCQLALISSNHLMEIAVHKLLLPHTVAGGKFSSLTKSLLEEESYFKMLNRWVPAATSIPLNLALDPLLSTELLRKRRNATIHKSSASADVQMARSALSAAVTGTRSLYAHFAVAFPYEGFMTQYPLPSEPAFSQLKLPK
jgi:hypothetical protein